MANSGQLAQARYLPCSGIVSRAARSDAPELGAELEAFPENFHEPSYLSYLKNDLQARVEAACARSSRARTS